MEIVLLDEKTIDEQVAVFKEAFNKNDDIATLKDIWINKHYKNPIHNSFIFGAVENGKVVGINAFLPALYNCKGNLVLAVQSCESGVINAYRGCGVWSKIVKYAIDYFSQSTDYKFIYGFPNYETSYKGFIKFGWSTVSEIDNLIMVCDGKKMLAAAGKKSLFGNLLNIQKILLLGAKRIIKKGHFKDDQDKKELFFDDDDSDIVSLVRTNGYIDWKIDYKNLNHFTFALDDVEIANVIYSLESYNGFLVVQLFEINYVDGISDSKKKKVAKACIRHLILLHKDAAFVRFWCKRGCKNELRKIGFMKVNHHNPFILLPLNCDNDLKTILMDENNWKLSYIDLD